MHGANVWLWGIICNRCEHLQVGTEETLIMHPVCLYLSDTSPKGRTIWDWHKARVSVKRGMAAGEEVGTDCNKALPEDVRTMHRRHILFSHPHSIPKAGRPNTNGGMPNSGYHRDEHAPKAPYDRHGYVDDTRNYATGDGYYPEGGRYGGNGYAPPARGYPVYPNGMSSSGYPGPPVDPPYARY